MICFPLLLVCHGSGAISDPVTCLKKLMGSPVYNVDIIFVKSRAELMDKSTSAISPIKGCFLSVNTDHYFPVYYVNVAHSVIC